MSGPVFVFGSNLAGRHGKGAALFAKKIKGAQQGIGRGRTGNSYALPTKDEQLQPRTWHDIIEDLELFVEYARGRSDEWFELTPVGTGLAGYAKPFLTRELRRIGLPANVLLSPSWLDR